MRLRNLALAATMMTVLSACGSWNPFSKPDPKTLPATLVEFKSTMNMKQVWSVSVGASENYQFSPIVAGQSVIATGRGGDIYSVDLTSGRINWKANAGFKLTSGVGADAETIAVAAEKGRLLAFDNKGALLWKVEDLNEILSSPAVGKGLVVVRTIDNHILAFDAKTGARKWAAERPIPSLTLRTAPGITILDNQVLVALPGGKVASLALNNGGLRWEATVGEPKGATELERVTDVAGFPVLIGNEFCAASYQGRVGCFNVANGNANWTKQISSIAGAVADERFVFAVDSSDNLVAYVKATGASQWRSDNLVRRRLSSPASFERAVVAGDYQGYLHFLSREDGSMLARVPTDGSAIVAAPVVAGSSLVAQTRGGSLVALVLE